MVDWMVCAQLNIIIKYHYDGGLLENFYSTIIHQL